MEAVGEALLSAAIGLLFDKLASADLLDFARQQWVYSDLKKWETELSDIREELNDAENKQITDRSVKAWLGNLKDLAYDMEDILDEFAYEALQRELTAKEADHQGRPSKVRKLISTCLAIFNPTEVMRYINMRSKVWKITRLLRDISAQRSELGLEKLAAITNSACGRPVTTSLPYEPHVYGRGTDKKIIIDMLLRDEPTATNFSVVSIVAMGGMGKTTLAKLVCDDTTEPIANHFALKAWVCVSNEFDKVRVTKSLLNSLSSQSINSEDFHEIQNQLKKALTGKRFLIVLDDLWSDIYSKWDDLRSPFLEGAPGSKILVTTRERSVATTIGGHKNLHELKQLSGDDCWSVFQTHAFEHMNIDEHPNLESIGRRIVGKCGGLPLAAKALGGLLRSSEPREREWERVLHSKIWDLPTCDVIPSLRLSYNHLPSHLKRCFSYCAIFPQDYEFDKEELILLWMAEGLIQQSNDDEEMEDVGDAYFCELLSRSFFQSSSSNKSLFVMHDLINDLAKYVAGDTCLQLHLDGKFKNNLQRPESARHSTFIPGDCDIFKKFERFHKMEHLRTFISTPRRFGIHYMSNKVLQKLIPRLGSLRVLSLSSYKINEIPNEFGNLKLLRYLNLSNTLIQCLPNSIGNLFYLQTLKLSHCKKLIRLPISIGNLINLRNLDVTGAIKLQEMPSQIGKLKDLQILSNFIVGKNNSLNIKELKDMSHLRGELCISKLENVVNIQDARDAELKLKSKLESLMMQWSSELDGLGNERNQMDVLDFLQPCLKNLNKLYIELYGGPEFPRWIRDALFSKMVDLSLIDCRKCSSLPCLGQLPSLKQLRIQGMNGVRKGEEFYGETLVSTNKFFPSLESLHFVNMSEWEYWEDWSSSTESLFPRLYQLTIYNCPKLIEKLPTCLTSLTEFFIDDCPKMEFPLLRLPSLKELEAKKCNETVLRSGIELTSLTKLTVSSILGLIKLQQGFVRLLPRLQALRFLECEELTCLWEDGFESESLHCHQLVSLGCNLQSLKIIYCGKLERLPNGWQGLTCLETLDIRGCPKLVSFPEVGFPPKLRSLTLGNCEGLKCLPNGMMRNSNGSSNSCVLQCLEIEECSSLICFPKGQLPTTLKTLRIYRCENLKYLPEGMVHRNSIATNNTTDTAGICALENLFISTCPSLIGFPEGGLPTTLKLLQIDFCRRLESLPEGIMHHHSTNAAALQILTISKCSSLTSFPRGKFPSSLKELHIRNCGQLESISEEMFHSTNNSLQSLTIHGECLNLKALPDCLFNLTELSISYLKNLELFLPQMKNLIRLTSLEISHRENIKTPLSQWGLSRLTSLKHLSLQGMFPDATSFSDDPHLFLLPTTLNSLSLSRFQNLESLASLSLQTLTSLGCLNIVHCPKLRSILSREGLLPDTLSQLNIRACPLLQQRFSKENGEDWPKIAHIPHVMMYT